MYISYLRNTQESRPAWYIPAILRTLDDMGGHGTRPEVLRRVHEVMKPVLRRIDDERHREGELNWKHQSDEARQKMAAQYGLVQSVAVTGRGGVGTHARRYGGVEGRLWGDVAGVGSEGTLVLQ